MQPIIELSSLLWYDGWLTSKFTNTISMLCKKTLLSKLVLRPTACEENLNRKPFLLVKIN